MSAIDPEPGVPLFRDPALENDEACIAAIIAANDVTHAALAARRELLAVGYSVAHPLCIELDRTAAQYTDVVNSVHLAMTREGIPNSTGGAT